MKQNIKKREAISKSEANNIIAKYLNGWVTLLSDKNADFYGEIPESYVSDKSLLEDCDLKSIGIDRKAFYPTDEDVKVIIKQANVFYRMIMKKYKNK